MALRRSSHSDVVEIIEGSNNCTRIDAVACTNAAVDGRPKTRREEGCVGSRCEIVNGELDLDYACLVD